MVKKARKGLALFLAVTMCVSLLNLTVFATEEGTEQEDIVITTEAGDTETGNTGTDDTTEAGNTETGEEDGEEPGYTPNDTDPAPDEEGEGEEEPETEKDYVAQVGDDQYETLAEAIAAAGDGDTVVLLKDVIADSVTNVTEKAITLDLGGNTLTQSVKNSTVKVYSDGSLTVKNGTISGGKSQVILVQNGTLVVEEDAIISGLTGSGIAVRASGENATSKVDVYGTVNGYFYGISGNASSENNGQSEINIYSGASVTAIGNAALYLPNGNDTTNITGGTVKGLTGVSIRGGKLNVSGDAKITGDYTFNDTYYGFSEETQAGRLGDGNTTYGPGIAVIRHSTNAAINVNISGGEIEGFYALYQNDVKEGWNGEVTINVSGGSFTSTKQEFTVDTAAERRTPDENEAVMAVNVADGGEFITGGTFSTDVTEYVADGYYQNTAGTVLPVSEEGPVYGSVAAIGSTGYPTLQAAVDAARKGDTVVLLKDAEVKTVKSGKEAAYVSIQNKTITLDLAGHTAFGGYLWVYGNNAGLTVKDSSEAQTGKIASTQQYGIYVNGGNGTATVESGTVSGTIAGIYAKSGTVNVTGGTVSSRYGIYVQTGAAVNVSGGAVIGEVYGIFTKSADTTAEISGGTVMADPSEEVKANVYEFSKTAAVIAQGGAIVTVKGTAVLDGGYAGIAQWDNDTTVKVEGGTVSGAMFGVSGNGKDETVNTMILTGGTINGDMAVYHPQGGTLSIGNEDGTGPVINGVNGGVQICAGEKLTIQGGTITVTSDTNYTLTAVKGDYPSGRIADGAAVSVVARDYPSGGPIRAEITGGTFTSNQGAALVAYTWKSSDETPLSAWVNGEGEQRIQVSGGYFSNDVTEDYLADTYASHPVSTTFDGRNGYYNVHQPNNGLDHNTEGHWWICDGHSDCLVSDAAAPHTFGDWIVDTAAQVGVEGSRHQDCTVCGYSVTETIPALEQPYTPPVTPVTPDPEPTNSPEPSEPVEETEPPLSEEPTETQEPEPTEPAEEPGEEDLGENETPLAETPDEEPAEELDETETPLANAPQTGDHLTLWLVMSLLSALGLAWLALTEKKGKRVA